jgi:hypothetical protein
MLEGVVAAGPERMNEQALLRLVALEVVGCPEIAGGDAATAIVSFFIALSSP